MLCGNCHQLCPDDVQFCGRCGSAFGAAPEATTDASDLLTGRTINNGRYEVRDLLGKGGMGTVYRANDVRLGRLVALKVLAGELVAHATARRRMAQEAQALARIEHPNVVRMFDVFDEGPLLVMALELITGGDLESLVRPGGLNENQVVVAMQGILAGLQAIHDAGLIHRDVKPGNVLLTANGVPKVTDLGVARDSQAKEKTRLGAKLGTPEYMSPEQIQGTNIDARSDVYSAGLVMFELLTGAKPFQGKTEFEWLTAHVHQAPDMHRLEGKASASVRAVVAKALEKNPDQRFASANAMAAALATPTKVVVSPDTMRAAPKVLTTQPRGAAEPMPVQVEPRPTAAVQEARPQPPQQPGPLQWSPAPPVQRQDSPPVRPVTARVAAVRGDAFVPPGRSNLLAGLGAGLGLVVLCGIGWAALSDDKASEAAPAAPGPVVPKPAEAPVPGSDPAPVPAPMFVASDDVCDRIGWTNSNKESWLSPGDSFSFPLGSGHSFTVLDANNRGTSGSSVDLKGAKPQQITVPNHELLTAKTWNPMQTEEWIAAFWYSESTIVLTLSRLRGDDVTTRRFQMDTLPSSDIRDGHSLGLDFNEEKCGQRCIVTVGSNLGHPRNPQGRKWNPPPAQKLFALNLDGSVEECGDTWRPEEE